MAEIIPIDDPADPRIEAYRDVRERDLVGRQGLFVAEGKVVLDKLLAAPACHPLSLLVAAHRLGNLPDLLARVPPGVPVFAAGQRVIDAVAGFPLHRGLLAIGLRTAVPDVDDLLAAAPANATVVVLAGIANHDNMGGIFRNAAAFGAHAVLLDAACCDPLYRKAIRVSVGASLLVPHARLPQGADPLALLRRHGFAAIALSPSGAVPLAGLVPPARAALLLGTEGAGLPAALLAAATTVRIPMANGFDSLNVATTSGIVLHHLTAAATCTGDGAARHDGTNAARPD